MYKRNVTIVNKSGLHARPATDFVKAAAKFQSTITIRRLDGGEEVNAKSLVLILSLGMGQGTQVELCAAGEDEKQAADSLVALVESGFDDL